MTMAATLASSGSDASSYGANDEGCRSGGDNETMLVPIIMVVVVRVYFFYQQIVGLSGIRFNFFTKNLRFELCRWKKKYDWKEKIH